MSTRLSRLLNRILLFIGLAVAAIWATAPFLWIIIASFEKRIELFSRPPGWFPKTLYLKNYIFVLSDPAFVNGFKNSAIVAIFTTCLALIIGSLCAYALVRLPIPGKNIVSTSILFSQMLPGVMLLIPLYIIMRSLGLLHTYTGLVLANLAFSVPYTIWWLKSFFLSLPLEVEEAAMVDGCGKLGVLFRIVLPESLPGFLSTGLFVFINTWSEYMLASMLTNNNTSTLIVKIARYVGEESTAYEHMFVAAVIAAIPIVILALIFNRYIIGGITEGGVK